MNRATDILDVLNERVLEPVSEIFDVLGGVDNGLGDWVSQLVHVVIVGTDVVQEILERLQNISVKVHRNRLHFLPIVVVENECSVLTVKSG